uniref:RNase H type-1 domain-containing protein n=1 Tax=Fagus sylvatica TaxID=28930 RepID=A0A2N9FIR5_FAGSY
MRDIKDLLHHLVSGQAQMREDFQQMFQHLLARDNKPEGSNHEGPVGGNEENTTPISDFEKRMDKRMEQMEKVIKKARRYDEAVDLQSLSLYPEARLPAKFKMPSFDKFDSTSCPWFMKLGEAHTRTWEDICAEFTRYFNYNNEVDVTRRDLETTKQDPKETFSAFITRWRAKAAHMPNRPNEEEQLQIVVKNLLPVYNKHLFAQYLPNFKALVKAGTQIEDAIEVGIVKVEDFQRAKKFTPIGSSSKVQEIAVISKPNPIQLSFPKAPRQYNDLYMPPSPMSTIIPLPNHHNQRPHINCIEDQEMGDPSLLIHKIPSCNMLSWDELMEDVPAKPKIDIWKDGKATKASTQTLASQASSSRPMPYKATPYKYQAQPYNPQKIQAQPYNPQKIQARPYNPQRTQAQFLTPQKATQAQSFKHSSFYQKATQPPITRQSPINQKAPQALNSKHLFISQASSSTNEPKQSHPSQKAIQAPSPLKPTNTEAESPNTFLNQTQNSPEITHITRGGRHFKPPHLEADNPLEALSQQAPQPTLEDDLVLKQLQKTQANISLWSLLMASYSHRQAILKLLNQVQIPTDISPEALSAMIGTISQDSVIAFSDKDLPINGTNHNEALNITVDIGENRVPMVLIDNGSALNVCTLKTTICLGINRSEFLPSNQFVKAYDDTKREVHGVVILNISIGPMVQKVHFQVMDITASFNMLLGRPWLHETKAISSSLHQKVRFPYKGSIVTVHGDTQITPSKGPVLEIEPVDGDLVLSGFDFEEVHALVLATETPEFFPIYYDPYSNDKVVTMIRGMGYFPGMGLGRKDQGIAEFQDYPKAIPTFGLGYKPTEEELLQKKERFLARIEAQNKGLPFDPIPMKPYTLTLNGKFVKEGEEHPYHGFPEPWKNKSANQKMPGFEIFFNNQLDIEDLMQGIEKIEVKDWAEEMDGIAMEELLDGTVHMLGEKIDKDPSLLIGPTKDPLTNWVWGNGFANGDYKEEAKSTEFGPSLEFESVSRFNVKLSPVFDSESMSSDSESSSDNSSINEITDDSAYILSLNVLISQLMNNVIANNNEETPPTEERLVKPIKEEIESVNIGTNDEPKMMQIGKNLTPFEKDEFIALLQEFQEVFAWSYEDMPGIDTDIVQHSIPTDPTFRPVKQKLRRMKPEWTLKIKEEVEKQYNAGFLKVVNYPEWLANVVPVPKKDGKVRMCVDFRDLNKASPKDDFPLPHIDVLVDNTARHAMLSFMDGFSGYNQIKMAPEDMEKTSFITPWGTYCYKVMPFGLKNAGATYQRAATTLLHDMIHKEVEVYVDDMIVKSKERQGHTTSLRKFFERIRHYKLRLNPKKCMFGVTSGKLLGFIVSHCEPTRQMLRIKGRAIAEHLAKEDQKKHSRTPCTKFMWKMYFDGASNRHGSGIGILLVSPTDSHIPISIKLQFSTTNNMAEYEACILGLEAAISLGIKVLEVYGDSALIIRQAQKKWKVKEEKLQPYLEKLDMLTEQFDNLEFQYIPRNQNQFADALATLASMIDIPSGVNLKPLMIEQREQPAYCCTLETFTEEENIWYHDIHQYLKGGSYHNPYFHNFQS